MYDREQGLAESSHASSTLPEGDDQLLFTFMTSSTSTVPSVLLPGIYDIHVHLDRTGGNRTTTLYWTLTASSTDDTQTVLMTSEDSAEITNTKAAFTFHAVLATETDLTTGDRLVLKIYGDLGGGANTEITIFHDGTTDSHLAILTTSEVFNDIYLRNDGTNPLTANWNAGSFDITASTFIGALTGNADTVTTNANLTGEITSTGNATVIVESFLQENGASELTGETLGTACAENEILKTNATGGLDCAADATGGGALGQLGELTDVSTTTLAAGYIIFRNSDNTSWNSTSTVVVNADGILTIFGGFNSQASSTFIGTVDFDGAVTFDNSVTYTGVVDAGSATSLEIPNGAAPTVNAAGEVAVDTTDDQFIYYGGAKRVLDYIKSACFTIENLAAADDDLLVFSNDVAITVTAGWGHCIGTCTTNATIDFEDSDANKMTMTDFTTSDWGTEPTPQAISGNNTLIAYEGFSAEVTNAVSPETDTYLICFSYTIDAQ